MTYLKILMYARKGIEAEKERLRTMQEKALEGAGAHEHARKFADKMQDLIDALDVEAVTLDELEEIHNRG